MAASTRWQFAMVLEMHFSASLGTGSWISDPVASLAGGRLVGMGLSGQVPIESAEQVVEVLSLRPSSHRMQWSSQSVAHEVANEFNERGVL